jgi:hypothetical protein
MDDGVGRELIRAFAPRLQSEFYVEASVPLEIKLRLERLRLREMLEDMRCTGGQCMVAAS